MLTVQELGEQSDSLPKCRDTSSPCAYLLMDSYIIKILKSHENYLVVRNHSCSQILQEDGVPPSDSH